MPSPVVLCSIFLHFRSPERLRSFAAMLPLPSIRSNAFFPWMKPPSEASLQIYSSLFLVGFYARPTWLAWPNFPVHVFWPQQPMPPLLSSRFRSPGWELGPPPPQFLSHLQWIPSTATFAIRVLLAFSVRVLLAFAVRVLQAFAVWVLQASCLLVASFTVTTFLVPFSASLAIPVIHVSFLTASFWWSNYFHYPLIYHWSTWRSMAPVPPTVSYRWTGVSASKRGGPTCARARLRCSRSLRLSRGFRFAS